MKNILGYFLLFVGIVIVLYAIFINTEASRKNQTFSTYTMLTSSWEKYRSQFINKDGRVIDYSSGGITTSEGQSYALLRAVWVGDKDTFDNVWNWTKDNLERPSDHLFGWRWGKKANDSYGFRESSDTNSASDADTDIALALLFANDRWHDGNYKQSAEQILSDIWKIEVARAGGNTYLTAGNWAIGQNKLYINPSYFAPYAYRIFATVDTGHDWNSLIAPGYDLLSEASSNPLDKAKSVGLPPNWVAIDRASGAIEPPDLSGLTTDYSFDAMRVPWRIALDYEWNHSKRAQKYLTHSFSFLTEKYKKDGKLASGYSHDGMVINTNEDPVMYATAIGFLRLISPDLADKMYKQKLLTMYSNDSNAINPKLPYYEQNWTWFGLAFYTHQLKKL